MKLGVTIENVDTDTPELLALACDIQSKFAFADIDMPTGIQVSEQAFQEFVKDVHVLTVANNNHLASFGVGIHSFELMNMRVTFDSNLNQGEFRLEFKNKE